MYRFTIRTYGFQSIELFTNDLAEITYGPRKVFFKGFPSSLRFFNLNINAMKDLIFRVSEFLEDYIHSPADAAVIALNIAQHHIGDYSDEVIVDEIELFYNG